MVAQVITIVNQSGKVVKTSKTLVNVFNEAKSAYNERKAEIKASRLTEKDSKEKELKARKQLEALTVDDDARSRSSSRRGSPDGRSQIKRKPVPQRERPPVERGFSDSFYSNDQPNGRPKKAQNRPSPLRFDSNGSMWEEPHMGELVRRHTSGLEARKRHNARPLTPTRSASVDDVDMDLAYGDLPPPLPERRGEDTIELREKMTALQRLLDEANCVQHSAMATIDNLQKNPDALAAVALTLAEISNLAAKLAPGALATLKGSFPAIVALLASPQFAIAAGVGVGVTIIAFGGYKIVKKIKAQKEEKAMLASQPFGAGNDNDRRIDDEAYPPSPAESVDELRELSGIERWRRGIAEEEARSLGTSVDGEFITPIASRTLIEEGKLTEADFKAKDPRRKKDKKAKSEVSSASKARSEKGKTKAKSKVGSKVGSSAGKGRKEKEKEPSGLKMLFMGHSAR